MTRPVRTFIINIYQRHATPTDSVPLPSSAGATGRTTGAGSFALTAARWAAEEAKTGMPEAGLLLQLLECCCHAKEPLLICATGLLREGWKHGRTEQNRRAQTRELSESLEFGGQ